MAQRRMFSPQIIDSDAFLDMSSSAQNLYFHLGMRADDDGFVGNPKKIMRIVGSNDDDLKVLLVKRFVLGFENGVIVIKHWLIHNSIRIDRYHETQYLEEKKTLVVKDNKSYTEKDKGLATKWQPVVNAGQVRLDKDKRDVAKNGDVPQNYNLKEKYRKEFGASHKRVIDFYYLEVNRQNGFYPDIGAKDAVAVKRVLPKYGEEKVKKMIEFYLQSEKSDKVGVDLSKVLSIDSVNKYLQFYETRR